MENFLCKECSVRNDASLTVMCLIRPDIVSACLKHKILDMLPHGVKLVPRKQKCKQCSNSQPIFKFAQPIHMADAPDERVAQAYRPETSSVEIPAAEVGDWAISVLILPCYNESRAETVIVMLLSALSQNGAGHVLHQAQGHREGVGNQGRWCSHRLRQAQERKCKGLNEDASKVFKQF